jgi:predicted nucleotidyltransferase
MELEFFQILSRQNGYLFHLFSILAKFLRGLSLANTQITRTALPQKWAEGLGETAQRIVAIANPLRILLFGSGMSGCINADSDIDLLVVVRGPVHRRQLAQRIYRCLHGVGIPVDIIVATEEDIERFGNNPGTILRSALAEGQVIYENSA